ncbi:MAG: hypothetical protein PHP18_05675 [Bacilli bacterium]|nr:hypothetical protein [Bacilli bacterium]
MKGKKSVCVDLDGVLARYDGWQGIEIIGDPIPNAKEFMEVLYEKYYVIIHTTRAETKEGCQIVHRWLHKHKIHHDKIVGKPIAIAYIDDRALLHPTNNESYISLYDAVNILDVRK